MQGQDAPLLHGALGCEHGQYHSEDAEAQQRASRDGASQQHATEDGAEQYHPTGEPAKQQHPFGEGAEQYHPSGDQANQRHACGDGADQQHASGDGEDQQHPSGNGEGQQRATRAAAASMGVQGQAALGEQRRQLLRHGSSPRSGDFAALLLPGHAPSPASLGEAQNTESLTRCLHACMAAAASGSSQTV